MICKECDRDVDEAAGKWHAPHLVKHEINWRGVMQWAVALVGAFAFLYGLCYGLVLLARGL